jgi:hypothetical protein
MIQAIIVIRNRRPIGPPSPAQPARLERRRRYNDFEFPLNGKNELLLFLCHCQNALNLPTICKQTYWLTVMREYPSLTKCRLALPRRDT